MIDFVNYLSIPMLREVSKPLVNGRPKPDWNLKTRALLGSVILSGLKGKSGASFDWLSGTKMYEMRSLKAFCNKVVMLFEDCIEMDRQQIKLKPNVDVRDFLTKNNFVVSKSTGNPSFDRVPVFHSKLISFNDAGVFAVLYSRWMHQFQNKDKSNSNLNDIAGLNFSWSGLSVITGLCAETLQRSCDALQSIGVIEILKLGSSQRYSFKIIDKDWDAFLLTKRQLQMQIDERKYASSEAVKWELAESKKRKRYEAQNAQREEDEMLLENIEKKEEEGFVPKSNYSAESLWKTPKLEELRKRDQAIDDLQAMIDEMEAQ